MTTQIKNLDKVYKAIEKLKVLEAEIAQIHKLASIVAGGNANTNIIIIVKDLNKEAKQTEPHTIYADPIYATPARVISFFPTDDSKQVVQEKHSVNEEKVLDTDALQILGFLLKSKEAKKKLLINKLTRYGFKIEEKQISKS